MKLWCELAWLGGDRPSPGVVIDIADGQIVEVKTGAHWQPDGAERLTGLTIPGLANAHSHAFQRALRGRTHAGTGSFWTWREQMYELARRIDPDGYAALARATFAEMALAGITCVGEFHYVHHAPDGTPYDDPNAMGAAVIDAAAAAGIRITLIDACYLHGGIERFQDRDVDAWTVRVDELRASPTVKIGAAIHSVRAVDPGAAAVVAAWAGDRPLHAHVSEQPKENEDCLARYERTPTELLADAGVFEHPFTAIHATHLTVSDVALLGNATVCLCPTTERDLADGIGGAARLRTAGAKLAVGSDSQAVIDMFEEARAIELDERLATGVRGVHPPASLLDAATAEGHAALGWPDAGRIAPGAPADLAVVSLDGVRLAGTPADDAVPAVVFAAGPGDVRDVMVGGRWIVRDGQHATLDVAAELAAVMP